MSPPPPHAPSQSQATAGKAPQSRQPRRSAPRRARPHTFAACVVHRETALAVLLFNLFPGRRIRNQYHVVEVALTRSAGELPEDGLHLVIRACNI
jgi:hypothetical protein